LKRLDKEIGRLFFEAQEERLLKERTVRLKEAAYELSAIRDRFMSNLSIDEPRPSIGDILGMDPHIRVACVEYAKDLTISSPKELLKFVEDTFSSLRDRWIQRCRKQLIEILPQTKSRQVWTSAILQC